MKEIDCSDIVKKIDGEIVVLFRAVVEFAIEGPVEKRREIEDRAKSIDMIVTRSGCPGIGLGRIDPKRFRIDGRTVTTEWEEMK